MKTATVTLTKLEAAILITALITLLCTVKGYINSHKGDENIHGSGLEEIAEAFSRSPAAVYVFGEAMTDGEYV